MTVMLVDRRKFAENLLFDMIRWNNNYLFTKPSNIFILHELLIVLF